MDHGILEALWVIQILIICYLLYKLQLGKGKPNAKPGIIPFETNLCVQLPVYNEPENIRHLLRCISQLDWPRQHLEIQLLDDSTDATPEIAAETIAKIRAQQPDLTLHHFRRANRTGYKAGALNAGMQQSQAPFFAVFDADFRPRPDFLAQTMAGFVDKNVAAVQARWTFINSGKNLLTRIQTVLLNIHFQLEHFGRRAKGLCFNFNGTAGIWRRAAIEDIGGWSHTTVTEDLHLSYLAQLKGWTLNYFDHVGCPSSLPDNYQAFFIQQRRWAQGNGQVLRQVWRQVLLSRHFNLRQKFDVFFHLCGYPLAFLASVAVFVYQQVASRYGGPLDLFAPNSFEVIVTITIMLCLMATYFKLFGQRRLQTESFTKLRHRLGLCFYLLLISPILMLLVASHFWKGLLGSPDKPGNLIFHRTPKVIARATMPTSRSLSALTLLLVITAIVGISNGFYSVGILILLQICAIPLCTHKTTFSQAA